MKKDLAKRLIKLISVINEEEKEQLEDQFRLWEIKYGVRNK